MASLIHNTLSSNYTLVIGRIVLSSFFLIAGIFLVCLTLILLLMK